MGVENDMLPPLGHDVTALDIIMGAAATRDWNRQHHDDVYSREMRLPGVIMNAPTQTGWFHAYAMRWAGPGARIARWKLKMRKPVVSGAQLRFSGKSVHQEPAGSAAHWIWLDLSMEGESQLHSTMNLLLARPTVAGTSCWDIPQDQWQPPALQR